MKKPHLKKRAGKTQYLSPHEMMLCAREDLGILSHLICL